MLPIYYYCISGSTIMSDKAIIHALVDVDLWKEARKTAIDLDMSFAEFIALALRKEVSQAHKNQ
jgi:hypothetical protein